MKILMEISKQMNFSWKLKLVNMKDGWIGINKEVDDGNADVGFGGLWALYLYNRKHVYTLPWTKVSSDLN